MKNILCLVLLLVTANLGAQNFKLAGVEYLNYSKVEVEEGMDDQEVSFQEVNAFVNIPIKFKNQKTVLLNGLRFGLIQTEVFNAPLFSINDNTKNFYRISYDFTLIHSWSPKWSWMIKLRPTISSDLEENISSDDFLFLGSTLITRRVSDKLLIGAGLAYTTQTGDPIFIPVAKLKHETKKNLIDVFFPSYIKYLRKMGQTGKIQIGAMAALDGGNFHVTFNEFVPSDPRTIDELIYRRINVGPTANIKLTKVLQLELFGGYASGRKFQFSDSADKEIDFDTENGLFFQVGLSITPSKK